MRRFSALLAIAIAYVGMDCLKADEVPCALSCIKRLELPRYPALAWFAQFQGVATADILVGKEGKVERAQVKGVSETLRFHLMEKIKVSQFLPSCAGKSIVLRFHFTISGEPVEATFNAPDISFSPPADFFISIRPAKPME